MLDRVWCFVMGRVRSFFFPFAESFFHAGKLWKQLGACMEYLSLALLRTDLPVAIEIDSLVAVNMIQASDADRLLYSSLVQEIKYMMTLRGTSITHVSCFQNKVSDDLANYMLT